MDIQSIRHNLIEKQKERRVTDIIQFIQVQSETLKTPLGELFSLISNANREIKAQARAGDIENVEKLMPLILELTLVSLTTDFKLSRETISEIIDLLKNANTE